MSNMDYKKELEDIIDIVITEKGSDIHLSVNSHPIIRVDGSLIQLTKKPVLKYSLKGVPGSRKYEGAAAQYFKKKQRRSQKGEH